MTLGCGTAAADTNVLTLAGVALEAVIVVVAGGGEIPRSRTDISGIASLPIQFGLSDAIPQDLKAHALPCAFSSQLIDSLFGLMLIVGGANEEGFGLDDE